MRESKRRVSVVIGAHNYARFLPAAIDSSFAQDEPPAEVIVVDDGSTDETADVLTPYRHSATVIRTPNRGQLAALATGYAATSGEMVLFLDADDVLLPGATRAISEAVVPGVAKVHWPMAEIDADGRPVGRCVPTEPLPSGDLADELCQRGPEGAAYPPTSGNAWHRCYLEEVLPGPVDDFRLAADQYLSVLAPFFGTVVALDEPQSLYRRHDGSAHSSAPFEVRSRITNEHFSKAVALLRDRCRQRGSACPWWTWEERSWTRRLEHSVRELDARLPAGSVVVLVDQDEWSLPPGRAWTTVPIPALNGEYFGLPTDGRALVDELRARRDHGASHVVVSESAFWWLDEYDGFAEYLDAQCRLLDANDRLRLYAWPAVGA